MKKKTTIGQVIRFLICKIGFSQEIISLNESPK